MIEDIQFQCFSCKKVSPLKVKPLEVVRVSKMMEQEGPKIVSLSRTCVKCGQNNAVTLSKSLLEGDSSVVQGAKS